ncbi:hypothetical protein R6Q57_021235 [Mikania cordata]
MDTKSLAKSKRAHSLHHKKHHPNQKVKNATSSVSSQGTQGKAVKEKTRVGPTTLASNWDRYEDEDDAMTEDQMYGQTSQASDVVPKSKGADYAYLISEAKSQNSTRMSSETIPSLFDFVSDFGLGKESFFAVRGESLLSAAQNDNFFAEHKTPANYEIKLAIQAHSNPVISNSINLYQTKSSKPSVPINKLRLQSSLPSCSIPSHQLPERLIEAPVTVTDPSSVSTDLHIPPDPEIHRETSTLSKLK